MSLSAGRWRRVEEIFHEVADLPQGEQTQAVMRLSQQDAWIAGQVLEMVRADRAGVAEALARLQSSAAKVREDVQARARIAKQPVRIGPYTITKLLGQGGFGNVYLGEQSTPVSRKVAIKVVRTSTLVDTDRVLQRFIMERRTLAMLDHPSIARLIEAGETEDGQPYFSMEYVESGTPITVACDAANADVPTRLRMFVRVCRAIHHAHLKGVVHRDIKPGNVLVGGESQADAPASPMPFDQRVVKVIDFGISKLLVPDSLGAAVGAARTSGASAGLFASLEHVIGTPEYMSPEQARSGGHEVDTRSDIHALGVLLYELVSGLLPHDPRALREMGPVGACLHVARSECPRVSARLRQAEADTLVLAASRRRLSGPDALVRLARSDLASILARATAHEPAHRYESAESLAEDVENYLAMRPVRARRAGVAYRLSKFARRNRARVVSGVLAALLLGAIVFGVSARERARRIAQAQAQREAAIAYEMMIDGIAAANLAMERGQFGEALKALERVPEQHRAWEWRVLSNRLREPREVLHAPAYFHQVATHPTRSMFACSTTGRGAFVSTIDGSNDEDKWTVYVREERALGYGRAGVAFSPDGTTLALSSDDRLWLLPVDEILRTSQRAPVSEQAASKPGWIDAVAPARWIDPAWVSGARSVAVPPRAARINWSRDGKHIAVVFEAPPFFTVGVVEVATGRLVAKDLGPCHSTAIIHPTRPEVLWGDRDGLLTAFDWTRGEVVHTSNTTGEAIADLATSPEGGLLAIVSAREVRLLDAADYTLCDRLRAPAAMLSARWSHDGQWIVGASLGTFHPVWSAQSGAMVGALPAALLGAETIAFDAATGKLIVPQVSGDLVTINAEPDIIDLGPGRGGSAPLASDNLFVLRAAEYVSSSRELPLTTGSQALFFDTRTRQKIGQLHSSINYAWFVWTASHPMSTWLAWQLSGPCLQLRNIADNSILAEHIVPPESVVISARAAGRFVLACPTGWQVRDSTSGEALHEVRISQSGAPTHVRATATSPDTTLVQCAEPIADGERSRERSTIRRASTGEVVCTLAVDKPVDAGGFVADNSLFVAASEGLNVFDVATGALLRKIDVDRSHQWLQVLPDESRVITMGHDETVAVYDTSTWRRVALFRLDGIPAVMEDGTLVVVCTDRLVRFLRP